MLRRFGALCLQRLGTSSQPSMPHLPGVAAAWPADLRALAAWASEIGQTAAFHSSSPVQQEMISLNNLQDNPGSTKVARRLGRGIGSSKGKTAGRGHKGQKARTGRNPRMGFEGGQTPLRLRVPKKGFYNPFSRVWQPINLNRIQQWVEDGRLDTSSVITMKDLVDSGAVHRNIKDGVKLLGKGKEGFDVPLNIQVSQASASAREAVAAVGGSVITVYYNKLGLKALLQPDWFAKKGRLLPRPARAPSKLEGRFDRRGDLPPNTSHPASSPTSSPPAGPPPRQEAVPPAA